MLWALPSLLIGQIPSPSGYCLFCLRIVGHCPSHKNPLKVNILPKSRPNLNLNLNLKLKLKLRKNGLGSTVFGKLLFLKIFNLIKAFTTYYFLEFFLNAKIEKNCFYRLSFLYRQRAAVSIFSSVRGGFRLPLSTFFFFFCLPLGFDPRTS